LTSTVLYLKKITGILALEHALIGIDLFWQKCQLEIRQWKPGLFAHLT